MVQVDVFWTFAIGSSFAVAASKQLKKEEKPLDNRYFLKTLLFLSILFVPSGAYLISQHPGWETMFALYPYLVDVENASRGVIPQSAGILNVVFAMTNILCGILGFYLAFKFIKKDNMKAAHALWIFGYAAMLFILVVGWDGTGWERFTFAGTWYDWHQVEGPRKGEPL